MLDALDVLDWGRETTQPGVEWHTSPHMEEINRHLMAVLAGDILNLIIMAPPRHAKTVLVCQKFAGLYLMTHPNRQVGLASYGATLATDSCKIVRDTVLEHGPRLFGYGVNPTDASEGDWSLVDRAGRPLMGRMRSYGVGGPMLGRGNHLLIVDDPIKATDALSPLMLENCIDWWNGTAKDRVNPGGKGPQKIVMMQRLAEDDLVGHLLKTQPGRWTVLTLRAEAEEDDILGRQPGEYLWPKKYGGYDVDFYEDNKADQFWWDSKYQQRPTPRGGKMIKLDWIEQNAVAGIPPGVQVESRVRYWDLAATEGGGDYTAGVLLAKAGDHAYVEDVVLVQLGHTRRDDLMKATAELDNIKYPNAVRTRVERQPAGSGEADADRIVRHMQSPATDYELSTGSKEIRAGGIASAFGSGRIHVCRGDESTPVHWYDQYVYQLTRFPSANVHDDAVDATSGGFNMLMLGTPALGWYSAPRSTPNQFGRAG